MTIARGDGIALWRQIAGELEADIVARRYPPGGRLPTEFELAERFGVNRHTVRRAVASLGESGLVRIEQGRGTFVQGGAILYSVGRRTRFSENLKREARQPSGRLERGEVVPAEPHVAKALGLRAGRNVVLLETVGMADSVPISVARHYFPAARFPDLVAAYRESGSITTALSAAGVDDYTRKWTRVTARLPDDREAGLLEMARTQPVMVCDSVNTDQAGTPVEFGRACFAADRVQLSIETE